MKRRLTKILLIVLSVLLVLILAVALFISPVAKNYIVKHGKELTGRKIALQGFHLNIFTGRMEMDSLRMFEANDHDLFASVDTFMIRVSLLKLISKRLEVSELKVIGPYAVIQQNGSHFNYDDLIPKEDTSKAVKSKSSFPKSVVINNIYIKGGLLIYSDLQLKNTIRMNDLGVSIPQLTFEQGSTLAEIHLKLGDKATLNSKLALDMKTSGFRLNLKIEGLSADIITPYVKAMYNIGKLEGIVNCDLLMTGNTNHIMDFKISGTGSATGLSMTNSLGEPIVSAKSAAVKIAKIYMPTSTYLFDYIHATNANLSFILKKTTNNFSVLFKPEPAGTPVDTTHMTFKVKDLHVYDSQLDFTDKTLRTPYSLPVQKIDFLATNFDMDGVNEVKAMAAFPQGGNARLEWKGSMNDMSNQKIMVNLQNLNLKLFSAYCLEYTAFDITNGNLNFVSKNNIKNNNIESINLLDVYKMHVGDKHKDWKPEYKVPLKLALYILKDKDEKIKFDVPVKGSIKDPKFSYSKIIFKTLVNLMVKVAVSPVKFLANTLGLKSDKLEEIEIDPLQNTFTAQQYSQFNDLAAIVKSKPDMTLNLIQLVGLNESLPMYALYKTKEQFLKSNQTLGSNDPLNYEEVQSVKNNDTKFMAYVDTLMTRKGKVIEAKALQDKINDLYNVDSLKSELQIRLDRRNQMLKNYLVSTAAVPEKNLVIVTADKALLETYDQKAKYKVEMNLPGAEKPEN